MSHKPNELQKDTITEKFNKLNETVPPDIKEMIPDEMKEKFLEFIQDFFGQFDINELLEKVCDGLDALTALSKVQVDIANGILTLDKQNKIIWRDLKNMRYEISNLKRESNAEK